MIKYKNILIKNIYYMLAYAFQVLKRNNYASIASEKFEHIEDLFADGCHKMMFIRSPAIN